MKPMTTRTAGAGVLEAASGGPIARRRRAGADRLLHRHHPLHRLQGLRGGLQAVERPAGRRHRAGPARATTTPCTSRRPPGGTSASPSRRCPRAACAGSSTAMSASTAPPRPARRPARPGRSSATSSTMSTCSRTSATAAATASPPAPSACWAAARPTARRTNARSATTARRTAWSRPAPSPARPIRSSSAQLSELREHAPTRACGTLHARGQTNAYLYGATTPASTSALNAFFLLTEEPAAYNLPPAPRRPAARDAAPLPVERGRGGGPDPRRRGRARPWRIARWPTASCRCCRDGARHDPNEHSRHRTEASAHEHGTGRQGRAGSGSDRLGAPRWQPARRLPRRADPQAAHLGPRDRRLLLLRRHLLRRVRDRLAGRAGRASAGTRRWPAPRT